MATYVLIHGAGDVGWYWHLLEAEFRARGHDTVAPNLPCEDAAAALPEDANAVIDAVGITRRTKPPTSYDDSARPWKRRIVWSRRRPMRSAVRRFAGSRNVPSSSKRSSAT